MRNHFLRAGGIPSSGGGGGGGSSDTVTLATGSPFTKLVQINTGAGDTALNHTFSFDLEDVPTVCLLYTSPSPRDRTRSRMPSSA